MVSIQKGLVSKEKYRYFTGIGSIATSLSARPDAYQPTRRSNLDNGDRREETTKFRNSVRRELNADRNNSDFKSRVCRNRIFASSHCKMSEFEYNSEDISESSDSEDEIITRLPAVKKKPDISIVRILKELRLYYSNLFVDSFYLIDSFIKSKQLTYDSFLRQFDAMNFHQIYAKTKGEVQQVTVSPHHYITTTQDALAVASKFLRSRSEKARIGAVYLLYTLYKTQPLKRYSLNIKMEPKDYATTKELVDKCFNEGLLHPAYCFHSLDLKKKITISAATVNPCLEANYPRPEIRKHMARVADKHFQTEYEERKELDLLNKFQLIEQQMRNELTYINKLNNQSLKHDIGPEYKAVLSKTLEDISTAHKSDQKSSVLIKQQSDETDIMKKGRYKNSKNIAFPGVNEDILEDMVTCVEPQEHNETLTNNSDTKKRKKKKEKTRKRVESGIKNSVQTPAIKKESGTSSMPLSVLLESDSNCSKTDSDEDQYDELILRLLDG